MTELDALVASKEEEIARLQALVGAGRGASSVTTSVESEEEEEQGSSYTESCLVMPIRGSTAGAVKVRRGKAPPVDPFSGESNEVQLGDWLPVLEWAASWNEWSESDKLLQLAGHLRRKALQEWGLIGEADKTTFKEAVNTLRTRLDPGSKTMSFGTLFRRTGSQWQPISAVWRGLFGWPMAEMGYHRRLGMHSYTLNFMKA